MTKGRRITGIWEALRQFPPYYVRMLAKQGFRRVLSDSEIAIASGIDIGRVREIKAMTNWDEVKVGELLRFTSACNFDPFSNRDRERTRKYEKICKTRNVIPYLSRLKKSPKWESELLPLLKTLQGRMIKPSSAA